MMAVRAKMVGEGEGAGRAWPGKQDGGGRRGGGHDCAVDEEQMRLAMVHDP